MHTDIVLSKGGFGIMRVSMIFFSCSAENKTQIAQMLDRCSAFEPSPVLWFGFWFRKCLSILHMICFFFMG